MTYWTDEAVNHGGSKATDSGRADATAVFARGGARRGNQPHVLERQVLAPAWRATLLLVGVGRRSVEASVGVAAPPAGGRVRGGDGRLAARDRSRSHSPYRSLRFLTFGPPFTSRTHGSPLSHREMRRRRSARLACDDDQP